MHVRGLVQFDAGAVEKPATAEPKWQLLFPLGVKRFRNDFAGGAITFSREWLAQMLANWERSGKPRLVVDYFHRGLSDESPVANEDKVASGWIQQLRLGEKGLEGLIAWTDKARAHILADELAYLSPTFHPNAPDKQTGGRQGPTLMGAALLNDPFLTELPRVAASNADPKGTPMKLALAALVSAAKLSADTTEDNLEAALKAKADELETAKSELAKLKEQSQTEEKKLGATGELLKKLSERIDAQDAELKKMRDAEAKASVTALQVKLEGEGRIRADQKDMVAELCASLGLEKATKALSSWPVVVPLAERGHNGPGPMPEGGVKPEDAHKQLEAKAAEIAKASPEEAPRAYLLAAEQNPELAKAAVKLTNKAAA